MTRFISFEVIGLFTFLFFFTPFMVKGEVGYSAFGDKKEEFYYNSHNYNEIQKELFSSSNSLSNSANNDYLKNLNPSDVFLSERNSETNPLEFIWKPFENSSQGKGIIPPGPPIQGTPLGEGLAVLLVLSILYSLFCFRKKL